MTTPILDLGPEVDRHWDALNEAFQRVMRSGHYIGGPEVAGFEREVADVLGARHAVGVNSGTDALVIALRALGVGPGDEVVTTPFSFFATAESIGAVGAKPVFADIAEGSFNLDAEAVEAAITERTRALLPVHLYGEPAPMTQIMDVARRHGVAVVEDCAQSFGAVYEGSCAGCGGTSCDAHLRDAYRGRALGTLGAVGCFSFFPTKTLGAYGDAGLLVTDDAAIAELARKLRAHGGAHKYHNEMLGYNSRLDAIQAAMLRVKLPHAADATAGRLRVAERYEALLADEPRVLAPARTPGHVFHQYTVRLPGVDRDAVQTYMAEAGVQTMVYYPVPQHRLPVFSGVYPPFPNSELAAGEVLSLPIWPTIPDQTQRQVVDALTAAIDRAQSSLVPGIAHIGRDGSRS